MFNNYIFVFIGATLLCISAPIVSGRKKVASCLDEICRIYITGREFNLK